MNIVVTGGTGFVGGEIVTQLARRADVERVVCLSRRPLEGASAKVEMILHADFATYDDDLAQRLAKYDGCLWALGGKVSDSASLSEYERLTCAFPIAFVEAVAKRLERPFRFCYLSGMGADPTESAWLPWERETRHLKGRTERRLEVFTKVHPFMRATAFRPAGILEQGTSPLVARLLGPIAVDVGRLATAMIDEVIAGPETQFRVVPNAKIRAYGQCRSPSSSST